MAGRKKNARSQTSKKIKVDDSVEDAVEVTSSDEVTEATQDVVEATDERVAEVEEPSATEEFFEDEAAEADDLSASAAETATDGEGNAADTDAPEQSETPAVETQEEPTSAPDPVPTPAAVAEPARGMSTLVGGAIAACLGAGAMYFADTQGWLGNNIDMTAFEQTIKTQTDDIAALQTALAAAQAQTETVQKTLETSLPDLSPLQTAIDGLTAADTETAAAVTELKTLLTQTQSSLTATDTRLGELEVQPIPKAELPKEVVTAYETQLASILATIEGRFTEMQTAQTALISGLETDIRGRLTEIETAQSAAVATEEAARLAAQTAMAAAAAVQVSAALDSGEAFADPLATIAENASLEVPQVLTDLAAEGATSLADLQSSFPDAARTALAASADAAVEDGSVSPLTSFFATQLGARSLEPREGNSPDAILSRAEALVGQADIQGALAELGNLPPEGQEPFADWIAPATALHDAKLAAADLVAQLNNK